MKRQKKLQKLSKVKFLLRRDEAMEGEEGFKIRDKEELRHIMDVMASQLNTATKYWGTEQVNDLIQILRELAHILKRQDCPDQQSVLLSHTQTKFITVNLLTRDYEIEGGNQPITMDQLVELVSHAITALNSCIGDNLFAYEFIKSNDGLNLVKGLLGKFFLEGDKLQILSLVETNNIQELKKRVSCLVDMLLLTGNMIMDANKSTWKDQVTSFQIAKGLDHTLLNIVRTFSDHQERVGAEILNNNFWKTIVWCFSCCCVELPKREFVADFKKELLQQNQSYER